MTPAIVSFGDQQVIDPTACLIKLGREVLYLARPHRAFVTKEKRRPKKLDRRDHVRASLDERRQPTTFRNT